MKCGRCGAPMEPGQVEVHGTVFDRTFFRKSLQDLYWYDGKGHRKSRRLIIDSGAGKPAHGCKKCGVITIDTTKASFTANKGRRFGRRKRA